MQYDAPATSAFKHGSVSPEPSRVALVFGASRGIGRAAAWQLALNSDHVIAVARNRDALVALKSEADRHGLRIDVRALDISDLDGLSNALDALVAQHTTIDVIVNNTGGPPAGSLHLASQRELLAAFHQHVLSAQLIMQRCLPGMKQKQFGRIINVLSTSVKTPLPNLGVSNIVRAGMAAWAKTLSHELGAYGITVNNVLPGYTATDRLDELAVAQAANLQLDVDQIKTKWASNVPAGRLGRPEEVAQAIAFLASPAAAYISGINLPVDGGRTPAL